MLTGPTLPTRRGSGSWATGLALVVAVVAGVVALAGGVAVDTTGNAPVVDLDEDNFRIALASGPHLVLFSTPWMTDAVAVEAAWADVVAQARVAFNAALARVNCELDAFVCASFDVHDSFPALKFIAPSHLVDYPGERITADNVFMWVQSIERGDKNPSKALRGAEGGVVADPDLGVNVELVGGEWDDKVLGDNPGGTWFVKYYTDWCHYCKHLAPTWAQLPPLLAGDGIHVGQVNCGVDANKAHCARYGIFSYPQMKVYRGSAVEAFQAARTLDDLLEFAQSTHNRLTGGGGGGGGGGGEPETDEEEDREDRAVDREGGVII